MTIDEAIQLAVRCRAAGKPGEAEYLCRQILAVQPTNSESLNLLGVLACEAGYNEIAADLMNRAIAADPKVADYHSNLGNLLRATGKTKDAIAAYRAALQINPELAEVHSNLGCALAKDGQLDDAIAAQIEAIRLKPDLFQAHSNLGNALSDRGQVEQAVAAYRTAIALRPDHAEVHFNLAMCLLLQGDLAAGWAEYDWRLKGGIRAGRDFSRPVWKGESLAGRTILLHDEQGFGDTIQFSRYISLAANRGGSVIVECQPELIRLLKQLPGVTEWISRGEPLPAFDVHCPLPSLPRIFETRLENIPQQATLRAPADRAKFWRHRLVCDAAAVNVGLVWAGNPDHQNDGNRSIPPSALDPLFDVAGVKWISLQKDQTKQAVNVPPKMKWTEIPNELHDFAETAAVIDALDLVISVDTSVAHLAGAMRKPVWLMLPFAPDWRWLRDRSDSPWYPTMRLFRQNRPGDWSEVVEHVTAELHHFARSGFMPYDSSRHE